MLKPVEPDDEEDSDELWEPPSLRTVSGSSEGLVGGVAGGLRTSECLETMVAVIGR